MPENNNEDGLGGAEPDPFADLVLDENFVQAATRYEPPARTRAALARFGSAADATPRRKVHPRRAARSGRSRTSRPSPTTDSGPRSRAGIVVALIGIPLLVWTAYTMLRSTGDAPRTALPAVDPGGSAAAGGADESGSGEGREPELLRWDWKPQRCYSWNQPDPRTRVDEVPCNGWHLFEAVGDLDISPAYPAGQRYPSEAEWVAIAQYHCGPLITPYLGYSLDPFGRFGAGTIHPRHTEWETGTRRIVCGLIARSQHADPLRLAEFEGPVRGADQAVTYPAGACFRGGSDGKDEEVPCTEPHLAQSVGAVMLANTPDGAPPSEERFNELAAGACAPLLAPYLKQPQFGGAVGQGGWHLIPAESWRAGTHTTTCTIRFTDAAGNPTDVIGTFTPGAGTGSFTAAT
ncbi:septum formation family protein [Frankia sp. AiPs1]|uniref:septum formation family protein n=1 Tax=Frankia sp. AiPs1 TaxID=573493 RepID=UPI0020441DFE|nr:septum formation family protein [Frankia sp. AiPs1]MCM3920474.1 septum formation family protein [Frankia sp. AiPs1]